jgi:NADH dehydrogenase FAD-containing subunit
MIDTPFLTAGGGLTGLELAAQLAHHVVGSVLAERSPRTICLLCVAAVIGN